MKWQSSLVENFGPAWIEVEDRSGAVHSVQPGGYLVCEVTKVLQGYTHNHYTVRPYYGEDGGIAVPKVVAEKLGLA